MASPVFGQYPRMPRQQEYQAEVARAYDGTLYRQRSPTELQRHTGRTYSVYAKYGGSASPWWMKTPLDATSGISMAGIFRFPDA